MVIVAALLCALGGSARATVLRPLDTAALVQRADRVVLGTVERSESRWRPDHQAIYTDVTVRVSKVYKGRVAVGEALVVRREGGSVDGVGMAVAGAPRYTVGEEVLLFVEQRGGASFTVGMTQGKLHVSRDADGTKRVAADVSAVQLAPHANAPVSQTARQPRRLDEVEREILQYVDR